MLCGCPSEALCPLCLDGSWSQLRGVAACRGEFWAGELARRGLDRSMPWPASDKMLGIARRKVDDRARDPRLLEMLTMACAEWAAKRWNAV